MFKQALSPKTKTVLALLGKQEFIKHFYLAGGTGLALHLGHRLSLDLDFFTAKKFDTQKIISRLTNLGQFSLIQKDFGTINGELNGIKLDLLFYEYPLLKSTAEYLKAAIAHPIDIGLMKLTALGSRGSKKDFIDLYFICRQIISLPELFNLLPQKFSKVHYEPYHLIMGLTYFKDTDQETMPQMLVDIQWDKVKEYFQAEVKKII